jgi:hypothetical protein
MATARNSYKKRAPKRRMKSDKPVKSTVVTFRISDGEKERIDEIMTNLDIKRYSDVMRMALNLTRPHIGLNQVNLP